MGERVEIRPWERPIIEGTFCEIGEADSHGSLIPIGGRDRDPESRLSSNCEWDGSLDEGLKWEVIRTVNTDTD